MSNRYYGHSVIRALALLLMVSITHAIVAEKQSESKPVTDVVSTQRKGGAKKSDGGREKYRGNKRVLKELEHLGQEVTGVGKKVKRVDSNVKKVDKKVKHVDGDVENIEDIVTNIQNQIGDCYDTTVCAELEEIETIVNNININVSATESIVEDISDRIGDCTVCETLSIIDSKIDTLNICNVCEHISIIESVVENISNKIGGCTLCEELSIIDSKIDALEICDACEQISIIESVVENIGNKIGSCTLCDELSIIDSKIDELLIDNLCDATPITAPITITQPGSYCLANDIVGTIIIAADNVSVNLNDFTIFGATAGIESTGRHFITIQNGTIRDAGCGILFTAVTNSKIVNCDLQVCGTGCCINQSQQIIIDNCRAEANQNGFSFLESSTCCVRYSIALDQVVDGFLFDTCFATVIINCVATGNRVGYQLINSFDTTVKNVIGNVNGTGLESQGGRNLILEASNFDFNTGLSSGISTNNTLTIQANNISTSYNNGTGTSALGLASGNGSFTNYTSNGNGGDGIIASASTNLTYEGQCRNNGGFGFVGDNNIGLTLNLIVEANKGLAGAQVTNSSNVNVSGGYSNNSGHGLYLGAVSDFLIQNATVIASGVNGMNLVACQNGQLAANTVNNSVGHGILFDPNTVNCTINNCIALQNGATGINNMGGSSNALYGNNAKSNAVNFDGVTNKYVAINEIQNRNSDLDILSDVNNLPPQAIIITNPGVYTMTRTFSGQIIINASNVTLDLGGNVITGDFSQTPTEILAEFSLTPSIVGVITVLSGNSNVNILNGIIELVSSPTCPLIGIDIDQITDVTITDFIINNNNSSTNVIGIDVTGTSSLQPMDYLVVNNVVVSNTSTNNVSNEGMKIVNCNNVLITQFTTSLFGTGLEIDFSMNGVIDSCSISNNGGIGLSISGGQGYSIKNSAFSLNNDGIILAGCSDCSITNCSSVGNANVAFEVFTSSGCYMSKCLADGGVRGIIVSNCQECVIDDCVTRNGTTAGFQIGFSQNCILKNSNAKLATSAEGIMLDTVASSLISNCFVEQFASGIDMLNTTSCVVENCRATSNDVGMIIRGAASNACEVKSSVANSNTTAGFTDASNASLTDVFINNIAHTNGSNYVNIAPTTTDRVNGGFYNNLSI